MTMAKMMMSTQTGQKKTMMVCFRLNFRETSISFDLVSLDALTVPRSEDDAVMFEEDHRDEEEHDEAVEMARMDLGSDPGTLAARGEHHGPDRISFAKIRNFMKIAISGCVPRTYAYVQIFL